MSYCGSRMVVLKDKIYWFTRIKTSTFKYLVLKQHIRLPYLPMIHSALETGRCCYHGQWPIFRLLKLSRRWPAKHTDPCALQQSSLFPSCPEVWPAKRRHTKFTCWANQLGNYMEASTKSSEIVLAEVPGGIRQVQTSWGLLTRKHRTAGKIRQRTASTDMGPRGRVTQGFRGHPGSKERKKSGENQKEVRCVEQNVQCNKMKRPSCVLVPG